MNKRIKMFLIIILVCLLIPIVSYVGTSVYIGFEVYSLVESSFKNKGSDYEQYTDLIGRISYQRLDYSDGNNENWKINYHTFPIAIHDYKKAKAKYIYTIEGNSIGGYKIPVTIFLERRNGEWYITDISEPY